MAACVYGDSCSILHLHCVSDFCKASLNYYCYYWHPASVLFFQTLIFYYLTKNSEYKASETELLSSLEYELFSPVDIWPEKSVISASKLRYDVHFSRLDITGREKDKVKEFYETFKSLPGLTEYSMQKEVTRLLADLALSASSLTSCSSK